MKAKIIFTVFILFLHELNAQDLDNLKNIKPIAFGGGISLQTGFYSMQGAKARQPQFTYIVSGSPVVNIYGVSLPFSFTFSNYQRDFRQPFNQFGLSSTYKWVTLHLGYRNISYSQFGMAGYTLLGAGIELKPKKFRFAFLYGRSQKAVADDTSKTITNNLNDINYPAYKRMLTVAKIGYGTDDNFLDLHFLQGKDDSTSLPFTPVTTQVLPSKNQVAGSTNRFSFLNKKLVWQAEGAVSAYTRDIRFANLDLGSDNATRFVGANISTQVNYAYEAQLNYNERGFGIGAKYRKVTPDYKSMGAYYFQTDFEQILGNIRFNLIKNRLRISASGGFQNDNLLNKKIATTQRNIYNANVSLNPIAKFGIDVSYSNFGTSQRPGTRNLSDTATINQINNSINVVPRYIIANEKRVISCIGIFGRQSLDDRNRFTKDLTQVEMMFANLILTRSGVQKRVSFTTGLNYSSSKSAIGTIGLAGVMGGVSKSWMEDKLTGDVNGSINSSTFNNEQNGYVGNLQVTVSWKVAKQHTLSMMMNGLFNESKNVLAGGSFQEYFVKMNYGFTF
ncbi:MAG: hypothetical protein JNJ40_08200 [Bacteroidia bacterium]|nr:hypothetical protein [Bacteroidia bacterium]